MPALLSSMLLALVQLTDRRILKLLMKTVAVTLLLFAGFGTLAWFALDWALGRAGMTQELFSGAEGVRGLTSLLLVLLGGWLLWRVLAMAVITFYADEVVLAVEQRHYPHAAAQARDLTLREQFTTSLAAAGRALLFNLLALPFALALLVTGIGTAVLFWLVNAVLVGRELSDLVWLRHRHAGAPASPLGKAERFVLGGAIAALLLLPVVSFLAPIFGAASATHLIHRKQRAAHG